MKIHLTRIALCYLALATSLLGQYTDPLSNSDVLQMVKADFRESIIIKAIEANDTAFVISAQALIALKNAGVSQNIIELMLSEEMGESGPKTTQVAPRRQLNAPDSEQTSVQAETNLEELGDSLLRLYVTVVDNEGNLVTGLNREHIKIFEDKVEQQLRVFRQEDTPVSVGILIDNSGSMLNKQGDFNTAILNFVQSNNPNTEFFIVNFNDEPFLDTDFTDNLKLLEEGLKKFRPAGGSALYGAIDASLKHLSEKGSRDKKVLLVVTDGEDNASRLSLEEIVKAVQRSDAVIYTVGLTASQRYLTRQRIRRSLGSITKASGGRTFFPKNLNEVQQVVLQIAGEIRNGYVLHYIPTKSVQDSNFRNVEVQVSAPEYGKVSVHTRPGYFPQAASLKESSRDLDRGETTSPVIVLRKPEPKLPEQQTGVGPDGTPGLMTCGELRHRFDSVYQGPKTHQSWKSIRELFGPPSSPLEEKDGLTVMRYARSGCSFEFRIGSKGTVISKSFRGETTSPVIVLRKPEPELSVKPTVVMPPQITPSVNLEQLGNPISNIPIHSSGPGESGGFGGGVFRVGGGVSAPQVLYQEDPEYSEQARKANLQGTVVLTLVVQRDGSVRDIRVAQALGLGLDEKAIEAVAKWRFRPGTKSGKPVDVAATIEVTFRLLNDVQAKSKNFEPQPIRPQQYAPPSVKGIESKGVVLINYSGLPDEPMVYLLEKARKLSKALSGVAVVVTPPGDERVSYAWPGDVVSECELFPCSKENSSRRGDLATNGGYIVLRLVKLSSGNSTAEWFFRVAVHEFRHIRDIQEYKRRVFPYDWSRNRKTPHDDRPEEIRANNTVEQAMKKLREHRDNEWEQMIAEIADQIDQKWFGMQ